MEVLTALLVVLTTLVAYVVYKAHRINQTWKERGVPHKKPLLFIGNSLNVVLGRGAIRSINRLEVCQMFPKDPLVGYYDFVSPILLVKDVGLVQRVLIKDFSYFSARPLSVDFDRHPELANLVNMSGKKWKALRKKMTPAFTSGKLKLMFELMSKLSEGLLESISSTSEKEITKINLKAQFNHYAMDIIGAIAFGIEIGALRDGNKEFAKMTQKIFGWQVSLRFLLLFSFPDLCNKVGVGFNSPAIINYFNGVIKQTIAHREATVDNRNDFMSLMLTLKKKGSLESGKEAGDEYLDMADNSLPDDDKIEITESLILNNAFLFIMAGFDTSAHALSMLCHDLSQNLHVQDKLREELKKSLAANNGVFCYEVINETTYLDMCIKESLRKNPIGGIVSRLCTKEYTFPGTNVTVKPGDTIEIPAHCIHYDPEIYPEPERFIPERFAPDVSRPSYSWLPFGDGPRVCIAMRFAMIEIKTAAARLLLNYEVRLNPNTKPVCQAPRAFFYDTVHPVYFDLKRIS